MMYAEIPKYTKYNLAANRIFTLTLEFEVEFVENSKEICTNTSEAK